jgi:membrane protein YdbS with pleckstrin-like domain
VPEEKIQSVAVHSTPFQRRRGLATLHVDTAGAGALSHARIVDLALEQAEALREALARSSNRSGLVRGGI